MLDSTAVSNSAMFSVFITSEIISITMKKQQLIMRNHNQQCQYSFSHVKYNMNQTENQALITKTDNLNKNVVNYSQHIIVLTELAVFEF